MSWRACPFGMSWWVCPSGTDLVFYGSIPLEQTPSVAGPSLRSHQFMGLGSIANTAHLVGLLAGLFCALIVNKVRS